MERFFRFLLLVSSATFVVSCKAAVEDRPEEGDAERFAAAACSIYDACGCGSLAPLEGDCYEEHLSAFQRLEAVSNVEFDANCLEEFIAFADSSNDSLCDAERWQGPQCGPFEGQLDQGSDCEFSFWDISAVAAGAGDCEPGLVCNGDVCRGGRSTGLPEGAGCSLNQDACEEGFCSLDGICEPHVPLGATCTEPLGCEPGGYCHGLRAPGDQGECRAWVELGGVCDQEELNVCGLGGGTACLEGTCSKDRPEACRLVGDVHDAGDGYNRSDWEPI